MSEELTRNQMQEQQEESGVNREGQPARGQGGADRRDRRQLIRRAKRATAGISCRREDPHCDGRGPGEVSWPICASQGSIRGVLQMVEGFMEAGKGGCGRRPARATSHEVQDLRRRMSGSNPGGGFESRESDTEKKPVLGF